MALLRKPKGENMKPKQQRPKEEEIRKRETCQCCGKTAIFRLVGELYTSEGFSNDTTEGRYFCLYCRFASVSIKTKIRNGLFYHAVSKVAREQ